MEPTKRINKDSEKSADNWTERKMGKLFWFALILSRN